MAVGLPSYLTGSFTTAEPMQVRGEVWVPSKNRWSSIVPVATDDGSFNLKLTYGAEAAGTQRSGCPVGPNDLRTIRVNHWNFDWKVVRGEIIVHKSRANDVAAVFTDAFNRKFPIHQMVNPNKFGGNDPKMMAANNTSGFNCRKVVGNPNVWSPHARGIAVDINPAQNPYRDPTGKWWPSTRYSSYRPAGVRGMLYSHSAPVKAFKARGWQWLSGWDWHHFEKR